MMLYRVAMETGFRRAELASLAPRSIDFETDLPSIRVEAKRTKNRKEVEQPIRRELAEELRRFIEANGIAQDAKLWVRVTKNTANMLKRDLRAAREAWVNEAGDDETERSARERSDFLVYVDSSGRFADFHALRHSYISLLTRAGVRPEVAQELARHSDIRLTMQRYSHTVRMDGAEALDVLPSFPSAFEPVLPERQTLAATGTDDTSVRRSGVLHSGLHWRPANRRGSVHERASKAGAREQCGEGNEDSELSEKNSGLPHSDRTSESGEAGIRTLGTLAGTLVFETSTIGHSVTSPVGIGSANHTPRFHRLPVDLDESAMESWGRCGPFAPSIGNESRRVFWTSDFQISRLEGICGISIRQARRFVAGPASSLCNRRFPFHFYRASCVGKQQRLTQKPVVAPREFRF